MSVSASVVSGQLATFDLHKENHTHKNVEDNEITAQIAACNIYKYLYTYNYNTYTYTYTNHISSTSRMGILS